MPPFGGRDRELYLHRVRLLNFVTYYTTFFSERQIKNGVKYVYFYENIRFVKFLSIERLKC